MLLTKYERLDRRFPNNQIFQDFYFADVETRKYTTALDERAVEWLHEEGMDDIVARTFGVWRSLRGYVNHKSKRGKAPEKRESMTDEPVLPVRPPREAFDRAIAEIKSDAILHTIAQHLANIEKSLAGLSNEVNYIHGYQAEHMQDTTAILDHLTRPE